MTHLKPMSKYEPQSAQITDPVVKAVVNSLIFGINPITTLLIKGKEDTGTA